MRLLRQVRESFDAGTAFDILRSATANPSLASAAVFEIDALKNSGLAAEVDEYLIDELADAALGGTVAAVVARRDDDLLVRVAGLLAAPGKSAALQSRSVLALRLADTPYARRVLEEALRNKTFTEAHLREEVSEWLGD